MRPNSFYWRTFIAFMFSVAFVYGQDSGTVQLRFSSVGHSNPEVDPVIDTIPSIKGEMKVSNNGSLTYVIPVEVMQGLNNFQPNLSLAYDSSAGNGIVGYGWNLTGLSEISRGGKSQYIDGVTVGPQFDGNDPFYLDGQRLLTSDGMNFTTEKYSKIKITYDSSPNAQYGFIVQYTDGKIAKYKQNLPGQYFISVLVDAFDNEIHYTYINSSNSILITAITYGGQDFNSDKFRVEFEYGDREIPTKMYRHGDTYVSSKYLKNIYVSSTYLSDNNGIFREYILTHDNILNGTAKRLIKVEIQNDKGKKLRPLKFVYNDATVSNVEYTTSSNWGLSGAIGLGDVAFGDFYAKGKVIPLYEIKNSENNYVIRGQWGSGNFGNIYGPYEKPRELFACRSLTGPKIADHDLLGSIETIYNGTSASNFTEDLVVRIRDLKNESTNEKVITFTLPGGVYEGFPPESEYDGVWFESNDVTRDRRKRQVIIGDFNNDGLTDLIIVEKENLNRPRSMYFLEVGKLSSGPHMPVNFTGWQIDGEGNEKYYSVELDGDGIPEIMRVNVDDKKFTVYKVNLLAHTLTAMAGATDIVLSDFTDKTPLIFGDFNGDGLTDFITPQHTYSISDSTSAKELKKIENDQLLWWQYTCTGTSYIKAQQDFTDIKLAYISPAPRMLLKRSSFWEKFWDGTPDTLGFTEYANLNIIPLDVNNDGKTDLVSYSKFGRVKYSPDQLLKFAQVDYLNTFTIPAHFDSNIGFVPDEIVNSSVANKLYFHISTTDENGDQKFINLDQSISLEDKNITPLSLAYTNADSDYLDTHKSQVIIHDPKQTKDFNFTFNNEDLKEGRLIKVDNGSLVWQQIEYVPMEEKFNTPNQQVYSTGLLTLPYPYYIQRNVGTYGLVNKIHTFGRGYILTNEYRYKNAVQHLGGKGFLGFQQISASDSYESEPRPIDNVHVKYVVKDYFKGLWWTVKTFDPTLDNALVSTTYGSLDPNSIFTKTTVTNNYFDKGDHHYMILSTFEKTTDYLKGTVINKSYKYDPNELLLTEAATDYNGESGEIEDYFYTPEWTTANHYFYGKFATVEHKKVRGADFFSTKEEQSYNDNGSVQQTKKYGNNTQPIVSDYSYFPYNEVQSITTTTVDVPPTTMQFDYDVTHRYLSSTTLPNGLTKTENIDVKGRKLSETSELGLTTSYKFDGWGNIKEITDYLGKKTVIKKLVSNPGDQNGAYGISTKREGEAESIVIFDELDRQIRSKTMSINGRWVYKDIEYDIFGRKIKESEPYFQGDGMLWNNTEYDELGRTIKQTSFSGKEITTCYEGNKVTVDDGTKKIAEWTDASGLLIRHKDSGGEIFYSYYANGALKETNYDGIKIKIAQIDGWGNKKKLIDPTAGTFQYEYDNLGRIKKETNPKGGVKEYVYNAYGQLTTESVSSPSENTNIQKQYTYDPNTALLINISGTSNGKNYSYTTSYDPYYRINGKLELTPDFSYETNYTFDEFGRVETTEQKTTLNNPNYQTISSVKNIYDNSGILIEQQDIGGTQPTSIWHINNANAEGQTTNLAYGNGYSLSTTYNQSNLMLEHIKHQRNGNSILDIIYNYDPQRALLLERNNLIFNKDEIFEYDDLDRLMQEKVNGGTQNEYTYDPRGRMTSSSDVGKFNYNDSDYKLQNINFNPDGVNLNNSRGFAQIQYNYFKNPLEIFLDGKDRLSFEYSILETRSAAYYGSLSTTPASRPNRKFYSADKSIEISKEGGITKIITYITGDAYTANYTKIDVIGGSDPSSNNFYLHRDNQGTILAISKADEIGSIVEQRYFDAWGNLKNALVNETSYTPNVLGWIPQLMIDRGYTGHEHLKTLGLINMNARIYDPMLRRFMSPDNYVQNIKDTQTFNGFGYCIENPLKYTDVSGNVFGVDDAILIGIAISLAINGVNNISNGVPFWYGAGKATVIGGVSAAISFGIGEAASSIQGAFGKGLFEVGMHGISGGLISEVDGSTFASGFAAGAISAMISLKVEGLSGTCFGEAHPDAVKAAMIASGGLSGGISSSLAGGDFWDGMRQGLITSGLNEVVHILQERHLVKDVLKRLNLNPKEQAPKTYESIRKLLSDPVMREQYLRGGMPTIGRDGQLTISPLEVGHLPDHSKITAETDIFGKNGKAATGNIVIYQKSFATWKNLAFDLVHELEHRFQLRSGLISRWLIKFHGDIPITWHMAEYYAHLTVVNWGYTYPPGVLYLSPYKDFVNSYYPGTIK